MDSPSRSNWDEDDSIRTTNDDAQASKASCVQLGYFEDRFIQHFVKKKVRKPPLINRGYYTRHRCVSGLIHRFRRLCQDKGSGCQLLNLGAGFDTTFWQLKDQGIVFDRFVELDHEEVLLRKAHAITMKEGLRETLEQGNAAQYDTARGGVMSRQYCALAADLRDLAQVKSALDKAQLDPSLPTLILSECVLVYMKAAESNALVKLLAQTFATCAIAIYEPMNPESKFGHQMVKNLEARGSPLHGIYSTPTVEAHKERLSACGYERSFAADLNEVYRQHLDPDDRKRIEGLEIFDEFEEWHLIMAHYIVAVGVHDAKGVVEGFDFETYEDAAAVAVAPHGGSPHRVPLPTAGPLGHASGQGAGLPNAD